MPWREMIKPDNVDVVAPDGTIRCQTKAYFSGKMFVVDDMAADLRPGDDIRRLLPNGNEDVFRIDDPTFHKAGNFAAHYQVKVSRIGAFPAHTGGNYNITLQGPNSRVNIQSTDNSTNISKGTVLSELKDAIEAAVKNDAERATMLAYVSAIDRSHDQDSFLRAYQSFIASAANHMTIIAPFLPALAAMVSCG